MKQISYVKNEERTTLSLTETQKDILVNLARRNNVSLKRYVEIALEVSKNNVSASQNFRDYMFMELLYMLQKGGVIKFEEGESK